MTISRSNSPEDHRILEKQKHDNAIAHTSMLISEFWVKNKTVIMPQPPYSLDLAPAVFFLFPKLQTLMKGKHFATIEEIKEKSKTCFRSVSRIENNAGISVLYLRGAYFEGKKIVFDK